MSDQTLSTAQLDALLVRGSDEGFVRSEDVRELTEALELDARDLDELNAIFASHGIEIRDEEAAPASGPSTNAISISSAADALWAE